MAHSSFQPLPFTSKFACAHPFACVPPWCCRALGSFQQLLKDKAHCMAHPDALISAVGTKVYRFEAGSWQEDMAWSATLDQGWNAEAVREACYKALAMVSRGGLGATCCC